MSFQKLLLGQPKIHAFLGAIVDSGALSELSKTEREGMISEMALLLEDRLLRELAKRLSLEEINSLSGLADAGYTPEQLQEQLRRLIPDFDIIFMTVGSDFFAEYAVPKEQSR